MLVARAFGVVCFLLQPNVKTLHGVFICSRYRRTRLNTTVKRTKRVSACVGGRIRCYLDCVGAAAWTEEAREAHCCNGGPCYLRTGFFLKFGTEILFISLGVFHVFLRKSIVIKLKVDK